MDQAPPNKMQKPRGRPLPRGTKPEDKQPDGKTPDGTAAKPEPGKSGGGYQTK